jgi:hypothetical protein
VRRLAKSLSLLVIFSLTVTILGCGKRQPRKSRVTQLAPPIKPAPDLTPTPTPTPGPVVREEDTPVPREGVVDESMDTTEELLTRPRQKRTQTKTKEQTQRSDDRPPPQEPVIDPVIDPIEVEGAEDIQGQSDWIDLEKYGEFRDVHLACKTWNNGQIENADKVMLERPTNECGAGEIHPEAARDALFRLNVYRWFAKLPPVLLDWSDQHLYQKAAMLMSKNGKLDHYPKEDDNWQCWSQQAAEGAKSSLAFSKTTRTSGGKTTTTYGSAADAIDAYIEDLGLSNQPVGHRRSLFSLRLKAVTIGHFDGANSTKSHYFGADYPLDKPVVFPFSGPVPIGAILHSPWWSMSVKDKDKFQGNISVQIADEEDAENPIEPEVFKAIDPNYGHFPTVTFKNPVAEKGRVPWDVDWPKINHRYRVIIKSAVCHWEYTFEPVDCNFTAGKENVFVSTYIYENCR